jgi:AcrR family transcriptional regulator
MLLKMFPMGWSIAKLTVSIDTEFQQVILRFTVNALDPMAAAIEVFTRQGYDATTVDDLADAVELSRSTFFRRFGSKEDVVFSDHEVLLDRVESFLDTTTLPPLDAVCAAGWLVFEHHVTRRQVSVARFALLHHVPALRNRELITSQRYERAFTQYLRGALPERADREYVSVAFAAAAVALHNAILRRWLHDPETDLSADLRSQLRSLVKAFAPAKEKRRAEAVLVTVFDPDADRETILESIRESLG